MKFGKTPPSTVAGKSHGFYDLAKAHIETHGGTWFVADKRQTPQQWRAWIAYFAWLDDQTSPRGRKAVTFGTLEKLTVPSEWPLEFDASAPPAPTAEPASPPISPERRKQLADMLRAIVAEHELREQRAPQWRNMTPAQAEDRLEKLAADYARIPPTVSTQVMEKYLTGVRGEPIEFEESDVRDG
jgi:hypothetical protein